MKAKAYPMFPAAPVMVTTSGAEGFPPLPPGTGTAAMTGLTKRSLLTKARGWRVVPFRVVGTVKGTFKFHVAAKSVVLATRTGR